MNIDSTNSALPYMFFVLGACIGSFCNVLIYRLPKNESVVTPRSHCVSCSSIIPWYHNIPILSWIWLRGRCAKCQASFSIRYMLVELLMAILFTCVFFIDGLSVSLVEHLIFVAMAVSAAVIDIDYMILPNRLTILGIILGLLGSLFNPDRQVLDAFFGVLVGGGFLWLTAYLYYMYRGREGMGGGDVKLLAWIGAIYGWISIPIVILLSSLLGSIIGLILARKSNQGLKLALPFGPFLVIAALIYMLFGGKNWAHLYLSFHGLD